MKKVILIAVFVLLAGVMGGYSLLTTTMTDIFAVGDDGSGGPLFRIDSTGGIVTGASGDITVTGNDITFGNGETISNATNALIKFTDGSNTLFNIADDGTTGSVYFGSSSRNIKDGTYTLAVSTTLGITGYCIPSLGVYFGSSSRSIADGTYTIAISTTLGITGYCIPSLGVYFGSSSRLISDGTYAIAISTDATITGKVTGTNFLATSGKYGYTSSAGATLYHVILATTMAAGSSVDLTLADGKIGKFEITVGTTSVFGSFIADGTVTLTTSSGGGSGTTLTDAAKINVGDGGTVVRVVQNAFATAVAFIEYWYIN